MNDSIIEVGDLVQINGFDTLMNVFKIQDTNAILKYVYSQEKTIMGREYYNVNHDSEQEVPLSQLKIVKKYDDWKEETL